ncbi:MAG TPA: MFS transporter, partial [Xanthobacteraceae bacterium]|nr:MFS transporter [Xanthobacteraceae bacterium]
MSDLAQPLTLPRPMGLSFGDSLLIAVIGFLTLVDLFATQAILPSLAKAYAVKPAEIGLAANASTLGMAISGLLVGVFSSNVERKRAISLYLL